jgi:serine/threonine protein kinase
LAAAKSEIGPADHPSLQGIARAGRCPTIEQLNEQIPGLQFVELLGRGGSGWTFLATQESLSRRVAVKVLDRRPFDGDDAAARFRREAEGLARLNHPGIVTVHDFGVTEEFLYLVMEYVAGPTLRQRMWAGRPSVGESLSILKQVCAAVESAHAAGVLHRDLKPENILFASYEPHAPIKVADFGIAQWCHDEPSERLTTTGLVIGTPFYMAPEQGEGSGPLDHRGDVYSMGVIGYELLTGRLPLGRFPDPSAFAACGRGVDLAIGRALANRPAERTPDVGMLVRELDAAAAERWRGPLVAMLLLLLAVGAGACYWMWQSNAQETAGREENPFLAALQSQDDATEVRAVPVAGESELSDVPDSDDGSGAWTPDVGERVKAKWGGTWYDAKVVKAIGEGHFLVHYEDWPDSHDEVLPLAELRKPSWLD